MSPLGLASLNRKDLPIVVTLGGVGPCYASLAFYFIAFAPSYKLCDNRVYQERCISQPYYKVEDGCPLILVLYVDDMFLTGDEKLIDGCKRELTSKFEMKDLGLMHYFL
jgi:hypothetical protein